MTKYMIPVEITSASGSQTFSVEADSPEEAIKELKNGGGDFVEEEIEVNDLDLDGISVEDIWIG